MINNKDIEQIVSIDEGPCVSIYIPTVIAGDYEKNRILWKNAVTEAKNQLTERFPDAPNILEDAENRIDDMDFWANQSKCLAGIFSKDICKYHHLSSVGVHHVHVDDQFYVNPLLQESQESQRIFVLAASQNETKFFEAVPDGIYPVNIHDKVVVDMDEAMNFEEKGPSIQHHSVSGGDAYFHGNGEVSDTKRTEQYLRRIDDGLMEIIHDEKVPLVLAAVEEYHPLYKKVTAYNHFSNHMIHGNPEDLTPQEIHSNLKPVFDEIACRSKSSFVQTYNDNIATELSTSDYNQIMNAAKTKNVNKLLIDNTYIAALPSDDKGDIDHLIRHTVANGGEVTYINSEVGEEIPPQAVRRFAMDYSK